MKRESVIVIATTMAFGMAVRAETTAEFGLLAPVETNVTWNSTFDVAVVVTHNQRMAACAYRLEITGSAGARLIQRTVTPVLQYIGTDAESPLADGLPISLGAGDAVTEVILNLASADPPGNPLDGLAPGAGVTIAEYTFLATQPGQLILTVAEPQAAETQSDPGGALFDVVTTHPAGAQIELTVSGGPDINGDGHVDLRDFGCLQKCLNKSPSGACASADVDDDGDVDHADFGILQECLGGPVLESDCGG